MARSTTTIESVWAAKGNLPDNAIVATADGKYPALDGSLITNVGAGDLLAANNLSELTATASVARTNLELGAADTVEFGGVVMPAGTTAELDAVTTAAIGELMVDTDKNCMVRFTTASNYEYIRVGGSVSLTGATECDTAPFDGSSNPQNWAAGGLNNPEILVPSEPTVIKGKGTFIVKLELVYTSVGADPLPTFRITTGAATITRYDSYISSFSPSLGLAAFFTDSVNPAGQTSLSIDYTSAPYAFAVGTMGATIKLHIIVDNPTDAEQLVEFFYESAAAGAFTSAVAVSHVSILPYE